MKENRMFIKGYQDAVNGIKKQCSNKDYLEGYLAGLNFKNFLEEEFLDD